MNLKKLSTTLATLSIALWYSTNQVMAAINVTTLQASKTVGVISSVSGAFVWAFNLFRYLGWAGVIVGVGLAIFSLIYKLFATDSEEAMKTVQGYMTKAVIIVVAGILLISAGFIVEQIGLLLGFTRTDMGLTVTVIT